MLVAQKKNLEGNITNPKNSFAVLNNTKLATMTEKMGVKIDNSELKQFDFLKDLESAKANLNEKLNCREDDQNLENLNNLP
jgi:hypothetical protein